MCQLARLWGCRNLRDSLNWKDLWLRSSLMNWKSDFRLSPMISRLLKCMSLSTNQTSSLTQLSLTSCVSINTSPTLPSKKHPHAIEPWPVKTMTDSRRRTLYTIESMMKARDPHPSDLTKILVTKTMMGCAHTKWPCSKTSTSRQPVVLAKTWIIKAIHSCKYSNICRHLGRLLKAQALQILLFVVIRRCHSARSTRWSTRWLPGSPIPRKWWFRRTRQNSCTCSTPRTTGTCLSSTRTISDLLAKTRLRAKASLESSCRLKSEHDFSIVMIDR